VLSDAQIERYSRQIILRELGGLGQERLLAAACYLTGGGPALSAASSYLAAAGVGRLDWHPRREDLASSPAFADCGGRNPDVRLVRREAAAFDAYDVVLELPLQLDLLGVADVPRKARLGSLGAVATKDGALALLLAPASGLACPACIAAAPPGYPENARPIDLAEAGILAALVACRWITGIASDDVPRMLRLSPYAPTWREAEVSLREPCPRGCTRSKPSLDVARR
jgi:adenylyltransferase/sulfurtransferase